MPNNSHICAVVRQQFFDGWNHRLYSTKCIKRASFPIEPFDLYLTSASMRLLAQELSLVQSFASTIWQKLLLHTRMSMSGTLSNASDLSVDETLTEAIGKTDVLIKNKRVTEISKQRSLEFVSALAANSLEVSPLQHHRQKISIHKNRSRKKILGQRFDTRRCLYDSCGAPLSELSSIKRTRNCALCVPRPDVDQLAAGRGAYVTVVKEGRTFTTAPIAETSGWSSACHNLLLHLKCLSTFNRLFYAG